MSLLRNFATVGAGTASSRLLGFVRDIFIAAALGTGPVAEAYFVAQRLPNLFRRLFAEGAFASAFVPLFTKPHESEGNEAGAQLRRGIAGRARRDAARLHHRRRAGDGLADATRSRPALPPTRQSST